MTKIDDAARLIEIERTNTVLAEAREMLRRDPHSPFLRLVVDVLQGRLPQRPWWPAPGYDIRDEAIDPTDWSINPEAGIAHASGGPRASS